MRRCRFLTAVAVGVCWSAGAGTTVSLHGLGPYGNTVSDGFWTTTGRVCVNVSRESAAADEVLECRTRTTKSVTAADAVEGRVNVTASSNAITLKTSAPCLLFVVR